MVMISCLWRLYSCFYVLYFLSYCLYNYTAGNSPRPTLPSWVGRIGGWQEGDKDRFHAQSRYTRHIGIVLFGILQIYDWQHRLDYSARVCTLSTKGKRKRFEDGDENVCLRRAITLRLLPTMVLPMTIHLYQLDYIEPYGEAWLRYTIEH